MFTNSGGLIAGSSLDDKNSGAFRGCIISTCARATFIQRFRNGMPLYLLVVHPGCTLHWWTVRRTRHLHRRAAEALGRVLHRTLQPQATRPQRRCAFGCEPRPPVRLKRRGTNYQGDSRSRYTPEEPQVTGRRRLTA